MIFSQELRQIPNENPVYTLYRISKYEGFSLLPDEIERHGLITHFEWYSFRPHLTVEVQSPPDGYTYSRMMYKHKEISRHNCCISDKGANGILKGNQYHQVQTRFWLPRLPFIIWSPENFRVVYKKGDS